MIGAGGLGSPGPALPRRGRRRHARHRRVRRGRRVQPAAPGHPRPVRRRPAQGRVGQGLDRRDQPARQRGRAQRAPRQRQRARHLRGLRPDRRRHRQLRHPLHGQRRGVLPEDPLRLGLDLPLRRPGVGLRADARRGPALLPLPLPRAAAAGHGPVLRRGRRARRAVREHRLDPGQRGDQAAHRHRRAARRQADDLRRAGDGVPQAQGPQGPRTARCAARTPPSPS